MKFHKRPDETPAPANMPAGNAKPERYSLRLFVTGSTPRSARAIENIRDICDSRLNGNYDLEVVDIYQHPEQAKPAQLVVAPTLVKQLPLPVRRLIGDLSDENRVLAGLDLAPAPAP